MGRNIEFKIDADVAGLLKGGQKTTDAQARMEKGFDSLTRTGTKSIEKLTTTIAGTAKAFGTAQDASTRFGKQAEQSARTIERVNARAALSVKAVADAYELADRRMQAISTRGGSARLTRPSSYSLAPLAAGRGGSASSIAATGAMTYGVARTDQELFNRFLQARAIRAGRAGNAYEADRVNLIRTKSLTEAMDRERMLQTVGVTSGAIGRYRRGPDESSIAARARADVTRNLAGMSELKGKVTEDEYQMMVGRRTAQLQSRQQLRQNIAGGVLMAGTAGMAALNATEEQLRQYADSLVQAEDQLAELYGVGDNSRRRPQLRQEAIALSGGTGLPLAQIGELKAKIEGAFENMPEGARREAALAALKLNKLGVKDVMPTAMGFGGAYQAFGQDLGGGGSAMRLIVNRLVKSADVGSFNVGEVTPYLADVYQAFKVRGWSDVDADAAMAAASKAGMKPERYMTGLRNIALMSVKGEAKGKFSGTGTMLGDVGKIGEMSSAQDIQLWGKENIAVAKILGDNQELLRRYTDELGRMTDSMDVIGQKLSGSVTDKTFTTANINKMSAQAIANAPTIQMEDSAMRDNAEAYAVRAAGAALNYGPVAKAMRLDKAGTILEHYGAKLPKWMPLRYLMTGMEGEQNLRRGEAQMASDARQAGDAATAGYLDLKFGKSSGTYYLNSKRARVYTSDREAEDYQRLTAAGYNLTSGQYTEYMGLRFNNSPAADTYLEAHRDKSKDMKPIVPAGALPGEIWKALTTFAGLVEKFDRIADKHADAAHVLSGGARDTNAHND